MLDVCRWQLGKGAIRKIKVMQNSHSMLQFAGPGSVTYFRAVSTSYNKLLCAPAPLALPG